MFVQWVWKMACSSLGAISLENKCVQLLIKFLQRESDGKQNTNCGINMEEGSLRTFRMGDLSTCLVNDLGLWMGPGGAPNEADKESAETDEPDDSPPVDLYSLRKLFMLWSSLSERDYV